MNLKKKITLKISDTLIPYYFSYNNSFKNILGAKTDEKGVVLQDGEYKPTYIFQCGMNSYRQYKKYHDQNARKYFENQVVWLIENFHDFDGNYGYWYFTHEKQFYGLNGSWPSAMSQGMGIGLALMAYHETKDPRLIEILEMALKAFAVPVENGGFLRRWDTDVWFEEFPSENPSRVMNGFIFSLAGLHNLFINTGNKLALRLFQEGVSTLKKKLRLYDAEFISKYSLFEKEGYAGYAKKNYHKIHIAQLLWLYGVTKEEPFYVMAKKFLEIQKTQFNLGEFKIKRVKEISANNYLGNNLPENVYDDAWAWGGVWESYKNPEISFTLFEPHEIYGLSLYFNSVRSQELPFSIYVKNGWKIYEASNIRFIKRVKHLSNKDRPTFINVYHFDKIFGDALVIKFRKTNFINPVSMTEADVFMNLKQEIDVVQKFIQRRIRNDSKFD